MSSRGYYKQTSEVLPHLRDILGDELDPSTRDHDSAYSLDRLHLALPSTMGPSRSRSTWPQAAGPTLPPIRVHDGYVSAGPATPYPHYDHPSTGSSSRPEYTSRRSLTPTPSTPTAPYSFDVFRPTPLGLVHTSSSTSHSISRSIRGTTKAKRAPPSPKDDEHDEEAAGSSRRYPCPSCGKRFSRPSSLKTHEVVHSDEKPYECSYSGCGKSFTVLSNMRRHYRKMHEGRSGSGEDEGDEYPQDSSSRYSPTHSNTSVSAGYYSSARR